MGQAAQSEAQAVDPAKTRAAMRTGAPVTGAEALLATQVDQSDADAQQKQALATAATESIDDIRAKARRTIMCGRGIARSCHGHTSLATVTW